MGRVRDQGQGQGLLWKAEMQTGTEMGPGWTDRQQTDDGEQKAEVKVLL